MTKVRFFGLAVVVSMAVDVELSSPSIEALVFVDMEVSVAVVVEGGSGGGDSASENSFIGLVVCGRYRRLNRVKLKPRYSWSSANEVGTSLMYLIGDVKVTVMTPDILTAFLSRN